MMEILKTVPAEEHLARQEVIREALSWIPTNFHHETCLKNVSTDCGRFLLAVYGSCGIPCANYEPAHVPIQWHMHKDAPGFDPEMYIRQIMQFAAEVNEPIPGDLVVFWWGHAYAHGAIVIEWPTKVIHCTEHGGVVLTDPSIDPAARKFRHLHPPRFFSPWWRIA